jgi:hypothetical protein
MLPDENSALDSIVREEREGREKKKTLRNLAFFVN